MTVIVLDCAPETVRGELTRWFLEVKPGVFVGNVNVRIRDLLWECICGSGQANGAIMVEQVNTEQGFTMRLHGAPKRKVVDFEGIQLIKIEN